MAKSLFPHLHFPSVTTINPKYHGGESKEVKEIKKKRKEKRAEYGSLLSGRCGNISKEWQDIRKEREANNLPIIEAGFPLLLKVIPDIELDFLLTQFKVEIVSELEDGFILVSSEDIDLTAFNDSLDKFVKGKRGGGQCASISGIFGPKDRLPKILSPSLWKTWHIRNPDDLIVVEIGVECLGTMKIADYPKRRKETEEAFNEKLSEFLKKKKEKPRSRAKKPVWMPEESDEDLQLRIEKWEKKKEEIEIAWDDLFNERTEQLSAFISSYQGEVMGVTNPSYENRLPDSFTIRASLPFKGLKDIALNYPCIFEIIEPDEIQMPETHDQEDSLDIRLIPLPPLADAGVVCVIDSGIQENHRLLEPAIEDAQSFNFLPDESTSDVADYVKPSGHGTRVAGAILYPEGIPKQGEYQLPCKIINARVLDRDCIIPSRVLPQNLLADIVHRYSLTSRLYNHSISSSASSRITLMSSWAAMIDHLSFQHDVLFIQAAGNISKTSSGNPHNPGIIEHINAGRDYPRYLFESSSRISNPAQSLQALTVGSVALNHYHDNDSASFGKRNEPSAFTRSGLGIWGSIKPDVVEYGGDWIRNSENPPTLTLKEEICPELVRTTFKGEPSHSRDDVGTSYAAPKVSYIAAMLQQLFPNQPTLLYRALIANSARWPQGREVFRNDPSNMENLRLYGYGIPDIRRATENTPYRVTLISNELMKLSTGHAHIFRIPVPSALRSLSTENKIRIDVTLSYSTEIRRTRRNMKGYLATWLDWRASTFEEEVEKFTERLSKQDIRGGLPWFIGERKDWGYADGVRREAGTLQKDWAILESHSMPIDFCIAVRAHKGWSPHAEAKYALVVSFEAINNDLEIYNEIEKALRIPLPAELEEEVDTALQNNQRESLFD